MPPLSLPVDSFLDCQFISRSAGVVFIVESLVLRDPDHYAFSRREFTTQVADSPEGFIVPLPSGRLALVKVTTSALAAGPGDAFARADLVIGSQNSGPRPFRVFEGYLGGYLSLQFPDHSFLDLATDRLVVRERTVPSPGAGNPVTFSPTGFFYRWLKSVSVNLDNSAGGADVQPCLDLITPSSSVHSSFPISAVGAGDSAVCFWSFGAPPFASASALLLASLPHLQVPPGFSLRIRALGGDGNESFGISSWVGAEDRRI